MGYPVLTWRIYLKRPVITYVLKIEVPSILLTMLSFAVFWLDATHVGERLGYGVTIILAVQVSAVVTSDLLPLSGEILWMELLDLMNFLFCVLSLLMSLITVHWAFRNPLAVDELGAQRIDFFSRWIICPTYIIFLVWIYSLELDDYYDKESSLD